MNIRSKLVLSYDIMLLAVLTVGAATIWAMWQWHSAAENVREMRIYSVQTERLRAGMYRQINYGLDYLSGEEYSDEEYQQISRQLEERLRDLKSHTLSQEEVDHVEGLEETHTELIWMLGQVFLRESDSTQALNEAAIRPRLREIADDVTGDVAVLNQFYSRKVDEKVADATRAGRIAAIVIGAAVLIALVQLIAMVILTQRWLVRPFAIVSDATDAIRAGKLDTRVTLSTHDEWGKLGASINNMAASLATYQEQLRTKERFAALGEVAAYTAHNIRNPLAGIRAAAQVLQQDTEKDAVDAEDYLNQIIAAVDRLDLWVQRFLEFAKPLDLHRTETDINRLLTSALGVSHSKQSGKVIDVHTRFAADLMKSNVDAILLEQSLVALIVNALQSGGDRVDISTEQVSDGENDCWVVVTISDNGKGIAPEIMERLFRAFVSDKRGGTGLGLAQAKKVVDLHHGKLSVESEPGNGTRVILKLLAAKTAMSTEEMLASENMLSLNGTDINS